MSLLNHGADLLVVIINPIPFSEIEEQVAGLTILTAALRSTLGQETTTLKVGIQLLHNVEV